MKTLIVLAAAFLLSTGLFAHPRGGFGYGRHCGEFHERVIYQPVPRYYAEPCQVRVYPEYRYHRFERCERPYYRHEGWGRRW